MEMQVLWFFSMFFFLHLILSFHRTGGFVIRICTEASHGVACVAIKLKALRNDTSNCRTHSFVSSRGISRVVSIVMRHFRVDTRACGCCVSVLSPLAAAAWLRSVAKIELVSTNAAM